MVRNRAMRTGEWMAVAGLLALAGGAGAKVKVQLAPNLADYHVQNVAILGLANTTGDEEADEMAVHLVHALSQTGMYHLTTSEQFARDAKRTGVEAEHARMLSTWLKKRKTDELVVKKVLTATGFDAVIAMEVNRWEEKTLDPMNEGTSDTTVGVFLQMIALDGVMLWSAKESVTEHSRPYLPEFNLRSTGSGQAVNTARGAAPEPPEIKKVARELAEIVIATLPDVKKSGSVDTVSTGSDSTGSGN